MTAPAEPLPPPADHPEPPCLRRRGPARLDLSFRSGGCPPMGRRRVHLRAGRTLVVRVVPPSPAAAIEINADPGLHTQVLPAAVGPAEAPEYHAEYAGHLPLKRPWPARVRLRVVVKDGLPNPCRVTVPLVVWPSALMMAGWWTLLFLGVAWLRWEREFAAAGSVGEVLTRLGGDLPFLGSFLLCGVPVLAGLRLAGLVITAADTDGDE